MLAGENDHYCVDHFRDWLTRGMTGCFFANSYAGEGNVNYLVELGELTHDRVAGIEANLDEAGEQGRFGAIVFPQLRSPRSVARMLGTLSAHERWKLSRVPWRNHERSGATLVGLNFITRANDLTSVMGFAPLGCMPVTRRSPYVAIVAWTAGRRNTHLASTAPALGFIDAPLRDKEGAILDRSAFDKTSEATSTRVRKLLGDPSEDSVQLRKVAFCLSTDALGPLFD